MLLVSSSGPLRISNVFTQHELTSVEVLNVPTVGGVREEEGKEN